jgi:hypothetical protein
MKFLILSGLMVLLAGCMTANRSQATLPSAAHDCIHNLIVIENIKQTWAMDHHGNADSRPTWEDLSPYRVKEQISDAAGKFIHCPKGGVYTIGPVGQNAQCSFTGHDMDLAPLSVWIRDEENLPVEGAAVEVLDASGRRTKMNSDKLGHCSVDTWPNKPLSTTIQKVNFITISNLIESGSLIAQLRRLKK